MKSTHNDYEEDSEDNDLETSLSSNIEDPPRGRLARSHSAGMVGVNHQGHRHKTTNMSVDTNTEEAAKTAPRSYKEIIACIVERRLQAIENGVDDDDSVASYPRDPLQRLEQIMKEEEENTKKTLEENKEGAGTEVHKQGVENKREKSCGGELNDHEKSLVRRIVELRLAAFETEERDNDFALSSEPPQDPILRVMNMNAEETLIAAASLLQYVTTPDASADDYDAVVCTREIFELNHMIQHNNLEELGRKAVSLAQSFKNKLDQSYPSPPVASWQCTALSMNTSEKVNIAQTKDAVNGSHSPKVAKLDDDDESQRHLVDDSSSYQMNPVNTRSQHHNYQIQGIRTGMAPLELGFEKSLRNEVYIDSVSLRQKFKSGQVDMPRSDWWGVVSDLVTFRADTDEWESDSQSSLSNVSTWSVEEASDGSRDESMRKLPKDGEALQRQSELSGVVLTGGTLRESALDAKRRKKRELEALKISITKSIEKHQVDTWRSSVVQSVL
jgi:hypothetical protein